MYRQAMTLHAQALMVLLLTTPLLQSCASNPSETNETPQSATTTVIDTFEHVDAWTLIAADGVKGKIVEVDGRLRMDYDFTAGAGYCVAHREVDLTTDPNYRIGFAFKGTGPKNTLEFKLVDPSGENVWWSVDRDIEFSRQWTSRSIRKRHLSFAWGPSEGEPLSRIGAIEIAVTATKGGKGSIWIDDLVYERMPDVDPEPINPRVVDTNGNELGRVSSNGSFQWSSTETDSVELIFDSVVEFSAIELGWKDHSAPSSYALEASIGNQYTPLASVSDSDSKTDVIYTPESEARSVRLSVDQAASLEHIRFLPVDQLDHPNDYFAYLAESQPRGAFPPYMDELSPWTVIGLPDHDDEALMSSVGAIEPIKAGYSIEPMILRDDQVLTWSDASISQSLESNALPIPSVHWKLDQLALDITALATDLHSSDELLARYTITNTSNQQSDLSLVLASRPLQVLPSAQFLNTIGGTAYADSIAANPNAVHIDGSLFAQSDTPADSVLTTDTPSGALVDRLANLETLQSSTKSGSFPSAAQLFSMTLAPGESRSIVIAMPMNERSVSSTRKPSNISFESALNHERSRWSGLLDRTDILVPESESILREIMHANLAYILINADGEGIQPGSRSYERSWIRDGAMTSAALIALDNAEDARSFIEWYSDFQYSNGKIPCVVDARGPDPVDENDAPGEFIFAIRNSAQVGGEFDEDFARSMYPRVQATVRFIDEMRQSRMTPMYTESDDPILRACAGLMPESISHEGYSAKPMHSYWDDFWVYRGLRDAAIIADQLGEHEDYQRFTRIANEFGQAISDSVTLATQTHGINYVPGCVELGDFDATSSAIAFYPTGAAEVLDDELLEATFERAWQATQDRINGSEWEGMTPYEVRTVGTFIRLGWNDRAHQYMDWLIERLDPIGWRQWGEIAYREREPSLFVGDMPHTWVGSGAILSVLSMFAYEHDNTIILAGGVPSSWIEDGTPIGVHNQITRFGSLSYTMTLDDSVLSIDIQDGCTPPDGFELSTKHLLPMDDRSTTILINNTPVQADDDGKILIPMSVLMKD